jgi:hypothetical protein
MLNRSFVCQNTKVAEVRTTIEMDPASPGRQIVRTEVEIGPCGPGLDRAAYDQLVALILAHLKTQDEVAAVQLALEVAEA